MASASASPSVKHPSTKIPVTITYTHQDAQPPVYLAGSFSDPPWHPQEMKHTRTDDDRQFHFFKEVLLEPGGTFQYKFRLGPGEWWVLDETAPVVVDAVGNRNNVIIAPSAESHHDSKASDTELTKASEAAVEETPISTLVEKMNTEPAKALEATVKDPPISTLVAEKTDTEPARALKAAVEDTPISTLVLEKIDTTPAKALKAAVKDTPIPNLVVGKTDTKPRHGDDVASHAGIAQKEAHEISAADAEPDRIIRPDTDGTNDAAEAAVEAANSATSIDRELSPAPLSDEEAAKTDERQLSVTPIGEVAATASEGADIVAVTDRDTVEKLTKTFPHVQYFGEGVASGAATPREDKAPLFAYECVDPSTEENEEPSPMSEEPTVPDEEEEIDPNDPLLEEFPQDRMQILTKISTTESRLNADQTRFEGVPISPVVGVGGKPIEAQLPEVLPEPSPTLDLPPSPVLDNIVEDEEEEVLPGFVNPIVNVATEDALAGATVPTVLEVSGNTKGQVVASPLPPGTTIELKKTDDKAVDSDNLVAPEARAILPSGGLTGPVKPPSPAEPLPYIETLQAMKSETLAAENRSMESPFGGTAAPYPGFPTTNEIRDRTINSQVEKGALAEGKPSTPDEVCEEHRVKSVAKEDLNIHPKSTDFGEPAAFVATGRENIAGDPETKPSRSDDDGETAESKSTQTSEPENAKDEATERESAVPEQIPGDFEREASKPESPVAESKPSQVSEPENAVTEPKSGVPEQIPGDFEPEAPKLEAPAAEPSEPTTVEDIEHEISEIVDPISATETPKSSEGISDILDPASAPEIKDTSIPSTPKSLSSIPVPQTPTSQLAPTSPPSLSPIIPGQFPGRESGTSSAATGGSGTLRQRHAAAAPAERPLSPQEIRPVAGRGFLAAFWESVFVGWIGGWMRRLFGRTGGRA